MPTCTLIAASDPPSRPPPHRTLPPPPPGLPSTLPPPPPPPRGEPPSVPVAVAVELAQLYPVIRRAVRAFHHDRSTVDDITQLTALRVLALWDCFTPSPDAPNDRRAWAAAIAFNTVRNWRNRAAAAKRGAEIGVDPEALEAMSRHDSTAETLLQARETLRELRAAVTPTHWMAFYMLHVEGHTCVHIGRVLGAPPGTVYNWIHAAREEIRAHLARDAAKAGARLTRANMRALGRRARARRR